MTRIPFLGIVCLASLTHAFARGETPGVADKASLVTTPIFSNSTCPIMGKPVSAKLFVETELGRIYMCCKGCTKKILNDASTAYKTAYPTTKKVLNKVCPIKGEKNDAKSPTVLIQGHEVRVCCKDCIKDFEKDPAKYAAIAEKEVSAQ